MCDVVQKGSQVLLSLRSVELDPPAHPTVCGALLITLLMEDRHLLHPSFPHFLSIALIQSLSFRFFSLNHSLET